MDSTSFPRAMALITSTVRATLLLAVAWTTVGEGWGQTFMDGDLDGVLYTEHVGGYLGQGVSFADFNGDGNDDLTFTQWTGEILTFAGDGQGGFSPVDEGIGNTEGEPKCALWIDLDNDGDQDLFVTQRLATNKLYARMPDGSLQAVPDAGGWQGLKLNGLMALRSQTTTRMVGWTFTSATTTHRSPTLRRTGSFDQSVERICR